VTQENSNSLGSCSWFPISGTRNRGDPMLLLLCSGNIPFGAAGTTCLIHDSGEHTLGLRARRQAIDFRQPCADEGPRWLMQFCYFSSDTGDWTQSLRVLTRGIQDRTSFEIVFTFSELWSSGQSSWLQIQRSGFVSRRYKIFWGVMGPLSLVSTIEGLLERKSSDSGLETEITAVGNRHADHVAPSISKSWQ
jgi:hypothetical protein